MLWWKWMAINSPRVLFKHDSSHPGQEHETAGAAFIFVLYHGNSFFFFFLTIFDSLLLHSEVCLSRCAKVFLKSSHLFQGCSFVLLGHHPNLIQW